MHEWEKQEQARYEAWKKTPEGQANLALRKAVVKVCGEMAEDLRLCQAEVVVETYQGKTTCYLTWERELREREDFVFPEQTYARAQEWLKKYATAKGWEAQ